LDEKISELVTPRTWDDYVGQSLLKQHLDIKVRAAVAQDRLLDHTLLIAPPGAGKSTIVKLIADRIGDELLVLPMPMPMDEFLYTLEGFIGGIVFLDELHNAPRPFQEAMQVALADGFIRGRFGEKVGCKRMTFVGATTTEEAKRLLQPMVQRFKYRPSWDPYSDADMAEIVAGMASRAGVEIPADVCAQLAGATGGCPRRGQDLVVSARDLAAVGIELTADAVLELTGVDADGLTKDHLDYLRMLHGVGGVAGLGLMKSVLGMNDQQVQDLERTLVMRGLIRRGQSGRKLMPPGRAKIDQAGPRDVSDVIARRTVSAA
jgi:Holliday junction DNA helicase RuvB